MMIDAFKLTLLKGAKREEFDGKNLIVIVYMTGGAQILNVPACVLIPPSGSFHWGFSIGIPVLAKEIEGWTGPPRTRLWGMHGNCQITIQRKVELNDLAQ